MISVLICTFNSCRVLPACLQALEQQTCGPVEVVIVDNASADGTRDLLTRLQPPTYQVLLNEKNMGFAAAQNQAIRRARGEWLCSLNADVVLSPDFFSQLLQAAERDERAGALCGKLLRWNPGGEPEFTSRIDSTGIYFTRSLRHFDRGGEETDQGQYQEMQYVFGATGAAALYRRAMVEDISVEGEFFDEDFFAYREDADLAWRAQLLGWKARIFLPEKNNPVKRKNIERLGAAIEEKGKLDLAGAFEAASAYAQRTGAFFLNDATDEDLPAGPGTIACELCEQLPEVDAIYVPMGDTALIRGVADAAITMSPRLTESPPDGRTPLRTEG